MKTYHQITIMEAIEKLTGGAMIEDLLKQLSSLDDTEFKKVETLIADIKKQRGLSGRYGNDDKYQSVRDDYMTPPDIYKPLLELFNRNKFDIDVCCTRDNIPANIRFTKHEDGLLQHWRGLCFCNPPWKQSPKWIKKGFQEVLLNNSTHICYVIPSNRFESGYMQDYVMNNEFALRITLPKKRGFIIPGQENVPPKPSVGVAIVIFSADAQALLNKINGENLFNAPAFVGRTMKPMQKSLNI